MKTRYPLVLTVLGLVLLVSAVIAVGIGAVPVAPGEVVQVVWSHLTGGLTAGPNDLIIWELRLPRIALAVLVGGGLAVAGVIMQALFHNPLADPYVVGVSSGAAFGAVTAVALGLGLSPLGPTAIPLCAFLGALAVTALVYGLARQQARVPVATLLLTGIAVGSLLQAATAFVLLQQGHSELREVLAWLMGSVANRAWRHAGLLLPYVVLGLTCAWCWQRELNVLAFGDATAHHLGVPLERTKLWLLVLASLLAAGAVAMSGVIAFVGLIVPHIMRLLVGPNHRRLLPAAFLGGGVLLLWADVLARTLLPAGEVPIGIITSVLGAPFFLYVLYTRAQQAR
jgi:iron complex transport system permease protein